MATQDRNGNTLTCTGHVYVYNPNGTLRWSAALPQPPGMGASVADLNGDGINDVVVGYGEMLTGCLVGGGVIALDGANGSQLWSYGTHPPRAGQGSVYATPAIADVNGDGYPEIVFGSWDQCIYLLDRAGNPLWLPTNPNGECHNEGRYMYDNVSSTAALADLNADGRLEIVIGIDATTPYFGGYGGYLYILRDSDAVILAKHHIDVPLQSSPAIADLDGDGVLDIVAGTGEGTLANRGAYVISWHYEEINGTRRLVQNWLKNVGGYVRSSPAIGDLNGDGRLDVVAVVPNGFINTAVNSTVYAWSSDGTELFHRLICNSDGAGSYLHTSPVIADVAGDARPEIVLTQNSEAIILNPDGTYYTDQTTNNCGGQPSTTSLTYWANTKLDYVPAVGDVNNSGHSAVIAAGAVDTTTNSNHGMLYAWGGHNRGYAPWPQFHRDAAHTGLLDNVLPVNPSGFYVEPPTDTLLMPQAVTITWAVAGKDMGAGLAGYAVLFDHNPVSGLTTTFNITSGASFITTVLGVGTWYAHVRAIDRAGNGALTSVNLGPFLFYRSQVFVPIAMRE